VEIVFEGKFHPNWHKTKISSAQRSEQYLNQNFFCKDLQEEKAYLTSYSTSFR
jgi:hypothetical protein